MERGDASNLLFIATSEDGCPFYLFEMIHIRDNILYDRHPDAYDTEMNAHNWQLNHSASFNWNSKSTMDFYNAGVLKSIVRVKNGSYGVG